MTKLFTFRNLLLCCSRCFFSLRMKKSQTLLSLTRKMIFVNWIGLWSDFYYLWNPSLGWTAPQYKTPSCFVWNGSSTDRKRCSMKSCRRVFRWDRFNMETFAFNNQFSIILTLIKVKIFISHINWYNLFIC